MKWIYFSPHLDDAVYSCGGLIWKQTRASDQVEIWTICAGDPPEGPLSDFARSIQSRWQTGPRAAAARRSEDLRACEILGAAAKHFNVPDCVYRRLPESGAPVIFEDDDLFRPLLLGEAYLVTDVYETLLAELPENCQLICPLTVGGHMDHRLTRSAAEKLGRSLWYYAEYPYAAEQGSFSVELLEDSWEKVLYSVSEDELAMWQQGAAAYVSQLSTFWSGKEVMNSEIRSYRDAINGIILWKSADN